MHFGIQRTFFRYLGPGDIIEVARLVIHLYPLNPVIGPYNIFKIYTPKMGINDDSSICIKLHVVFHSDCTKLHPHQQYISLLSLVFHTFVILAVLPFHDRHSNMSKIHGGFDLHLFEDY